MKETIDPTTDQYKLTVEETENQQRSSTEDEEGKERKKTHHKGREKQKTTEKEEKELPTLSEVIREETQRKETPFSPTLTLKKILGGDILNTSTVRKEIPFIIFVGVVLFIQIAVRYSCQKKLIEIDQLQKELLDARYKSLSSNSLITEKSRESNVLKYLRENKDSTLKMPNQPPYIINVPTE